MKTKFLLALACTICISSEALAVSRDAATDDRGQAVRSTNGTCIRTKWDFKTDVCAPAPKVQPAPEPTPPPAVVEKAPEPAPAPTTKMAKELTKQERSVYFDFDKDNIRPGEQDKLDTLAKILLSDKEVESVKIVAFADKMGTEKYNEALSHRRADAVTKYLNDKGYLKTTPEVKWFGDTEPKTTCPAKMKRSERIACLQEDRRAEVVIHYYEVVEVPVSTPTIPATNTDAPVPAVTPLVEKPATPAQ